MAGFYLMHRGWQDDPIFRNEAFSRRDAFVWLIEEAAFADRFVAAPKGEIRLKRGQLSASFRFMAKAWKWDESRVRRFISSLQKDKKIDASTDAGQTIITICNYEKYQGDSTKGDAGSDAASTRHRRGDAANYKQGKQINNKPPTPLDGENRPESGWKEYAFVGKTIRLTVPDFERWREAYSGIRDLRAELTSIDDWLDGADQTTRGRWFHSVSRMLARKHDEAKAVAPGGQTSATDAFIRRMEAFEAKQKEDQT